MSCTDSRCNEDRESKMLVVSADPLIWCDPCLVDIVRALNDAGVRTVASCCGHRRRPAVIALSDGREIIIARSFDEARKIDAIFPTINDAFEDQEG